MMRKLSVALMALALAACWTDEDCTDINTGGTQVCRVDTNLDFGPFGNEQSWVVFYYYYDHEAPPIASTASLIIGKTLYQHELTELEIRCTAPTTQPHDDAECAWLH